MGRFTSVDPIKSGLNWYSYCDNNPVTRVDKSGNAWETVFDIISLGASIAEVCANPYDPWAWGGLAGDVIDVAVPFLGGVGETVKALKYASKAADVADDIIDAADTVHDISKAADKIDDAVDAAKDLARTADGDIANKYFQDSMGRWHRTNGQYASNLEVGIKPYSKNNFSTHGNALSDSRINYGYMLSDRDTKEILKFGETLHPTTRYTKKYLDSINADMKILEQGSKLDIHYWQFDMKCYYKSKYGTFPPLSYKGW